MAHPNPTPRRPEPRRNVLLRGLIFAAIALFLFLSVCAWDIGQHVGNWQFALAQLRRGNEEQDAQTAIEQSEAALKWNPDNVDVLKYQITLYRKQGDLEQALAKAGELVDATPKASDQHFSALNTRCDVLQAMGRHQEAIAGADALVELARQASPLQPRPDIVSMLNTRAYFIARAAAAAQATDQQKGEALQDMATVFQSLRAARNKLSTDDLHAKMLYWEIEMNYLDTLAYLQLYAGEPQQALRNLNRCVEQAEYLIQLLQAVAHNRIEFADLGEMSEQLQSHYAVILRHRGEALLAADNRSAAARDFQRAKNLGYNKELGVW